MAGVDVEGLAAVLAVDQSEVLLEAPRLVHPPDLLHPFGLGHDVERRGASSGHGGGVRGDYAPAMAEDESETGADIDEEADDDVADVDDDLESADEDGPAVDALDDDAPQDSDEADDEADEEEDDEEADDDEVAYELDDWSGESRLLVDGLLTNQGIAHVWEGGTLVVRSADEEVVDQIIDEIDITTVPALDPDADKLAYEVGAWTDAQRTELAEVLGAAGIAYEWDEVGDLLVLESDEDRVEELLDGLEFPDALDAGLEDDPGDGLAAQEVMSALFISADRLMHDARDSEGVLSLVDAAARSRTLALPFGFERETWDGIVARASALADQFERDVDDDDEITERATELRNLLRNYV